MCYVKKVWLWSEIKFYLLTYLLTEPSEQAGIGRKWQTILWKSTSLLKSQLFKNITVDGIYSILYYILYGKVSQYLSNLWFFNVFIIRQAHLRPKAPQFFSFTDPCEVRGLKSKTVRIIPHDPVQKRFEIESPFLQQCYLVHLFQKVRISCLPFKKIKFWW